MFLFHIRAEYITVDLEFVLVSNYRPYLHTHNYEILKKALKPLYQSTMMVYLVFSFKGASVAVRKLQIKQLHLGRQTLLELKQVRELSGM